MLELTDYAPLPLREPVRSLVWIRGQLHQVPASAVAAMLDLIAAEDPNPALLQVNPAPERDGDTPARCALEVESVVVADATGAESVGVDSLLEAQPDPFCAMESSWLQHIDSDHHDVVARLAARLPGPLRRGRVRRSAWTATGSGCGSRARTATTTSGCRSCARSTTCTA